MCQALVGITANKRHWRQTELSCIELTGSHHFPIAHLPRGTLPGPLASLVHPLSHNASLPSAPGCSLTKARYNRHICSHVQSGLFICVLLSVIRIRHNELEGVNNIKRQQERGEEAKEKGLSTGNSISCSFGVASLSAKCNPL